MSSDPPGDNALSGKGNADSARELTLLDVTLLGVGAMIGGSVFILIGVAVGEAEPALILMFASFAVTASGQPFRPIRLAA